MPIKYARTGRRTFGADKFHLESIHPDVQFPVRNVENTVLNVNTPAGSSGGAITLSDSANIDAFARLRVSNPTGLFASQLQYDLHRILWEDAVTDNSGNAEVTHDADGAAALMTVEADDDIIRQSREYLRYQPGKSQMILMTFVMDAPDAELTQRAGYFDDENGIFLEVDGATDVNIVRRSNATGTPVDTQVEQANWNIDKFDGTGPSGYTLDFETAQILFIDLEWLGVGRVRVGFVVDGIPYYAHEFLHANVIYAVYMTTANLPLRYQITATASLVGSKTLKVICNQVSSEGGVDDALGLMFAKSNDITTRSVNQAGVCLLAIRPKLTFNGVTNRGHIRPETVSIFSEDQSAHYEILWGATITAGAWVSVNADSIVEYNITATGWSGGISFAEGYVAVGNVNDASEAHSLSERYPITLDISGAHPTTPYTDTVCIVAQSMVAQSTDMAAAIMWREVR